MAEDTEDNSYPKRSENELLDDNKQKASSLDKKHKNKVNNNIINDDLDYFKFNKGDFVRIKNISSISSKSSSFGIILNKSKVCILYKNIYKSNSFVD